MIRKFLQRTLILRHVQIAGYITLFFVLQIRERFKRRMNMVFPSCTKQNSIKKSAKIKPNEVGDVWAVELQACGECEWKLH